MSKHTLAEAWAVVRETERLLKRDAAKKSPPVVATAKAPAEKPLTWPEAVEKLATANGWSKARAARELEKLPGGSAKRQEYIQRANAEARDRQTADRAQAKAARAAFGR